MTKFSLYLEEVRIHHWIKNLLVFAPAFFTVQIYKSVSDVHLLFTFISFCLSASVIYLINDLHDVETDKLSPNNMKRPYAASMLSDKDLYKMIFVLSLVLFICLIISKVGIPILLYVLSNFFYSLYLKKIAVLDVLLICLGFECRIWAGAVAIDVMLSPWLIIIVFLLALFLILSKRRTEAVEYAVTKLALRENISFYQKLPIHTILYFIGALILLIYLAYCFSSDVKTRLSSDIYLSSIFVAMGLIRYLFITIIKKNPLYPTEIIWQDRILQMIFMAWLCSLFLLIY